MQLFITWPAIIKRFFLPLPINSKAPQSCEWPQPRLCNWWSHLTVAFWALERIDLPLLFDALTPLRWVDFTRSVNGSRSRLRGVGTTHRQHTRSASNDGGLAVMMIAASFHAAPPQFFSRLNRPSMDHLLAQKMFISSARRSHKADRVNRCLLRFPDLSSNCIHRHVPFTHS